MKPEKFPRGLGITIAVAAIVLVVAGVAVPGVASGPAPAYRHQKPKVDVTKIGVESRVSHVHALGMEGTIAHTAEHTAVEASIFASPGGRYTAEDIARNGIVPPAKRFDGIVSVHDMHPPKGARVCPVTMTKANASFPWWIGGKLYTFCCPPCVEEWVMKAKASKSPLPPPELFVAR